ncbi:hypothetical protein PVAND_015879 [Polypedilum vanderplanki]|uniref:Uncharacterized protein n=1 Tax=Polypedilum vanderplanki TaxID=319348 RepID=A0A9J6BDX4_POLVA|nr:hypothetical protein PVAND_015879 [Polypedilum vanderplanki]
MKIVILFVSIFVTSTFSARTSTTTIKCDNQQKFDKSQLCSVTNRFYDFDSWQIERIRGITKLIISDIQSEFLPTGISESFPNLISYVTSETTFKSVKKENFRNLKKLETLELKNGQLSRVRRDAFEDLENLVKLNLDNNMIKLISPEHFRELGRLEFLSFNNNEIEELNPRIFRNLLNLKSISAENNKIYSILEGTFESNQNLRNISLKGNSLRFIDEKTFQGLEDLKTVDLQENNCIDKKYEVNEKFRKFLGMIRNDVSETCQNEIKN